MPDDDYEYPYGDAQTHEALADLDRRLKALEPKPEKAEADPDIQRPSVFVEKAPVEYPTDFDVVE